jgi:error-prone DNA polymerase
MPPGQPASVLPAYAELHCRSNFSFLTGASHPAELVAQAHALGYRALALTDECSLAGVVRAHEAAAEVGLHLIIGAEMRLAPSPLGRVALQQPQELAAAAAGAQVGTARATAIPARPRVNARNHNGKGHGNPQGRLPGREPLSHPHRPSGDGARLVLLAQTHRGYRNLSQWITIARRRADKGQYRAYPSDLEGRATDAPWLAGLGDCLALLVVDGPEGDDGSALPPDFSTVYAQATWLKSVLGPDRCGLALALRHRRFDEEREAIARRVSVLSGLPVVATGDVLMHCPSRKPLQDVLAATRHRCTVSQAGLRLEANGEAHLRTRARLGELYEPAWLQAAADWAGRCSFSLTELRYAYPRELVPDGHTPTTWLRALTEAGVRWRYPGGEPERVRNEIERELALIEQLNYEPFFLTVADLVTWARGRNILCQGRGSAANSTVCFCLGVTAVDPTRTQLLFERFVSVERKEPPDIDLDFEHQRREEVIQYIYRKYGRHRAAMTAVVISYRGRSALRDVGRALGFDLDRIEAVTKQVAWWTDHGRFDPETLREHGFDPEAPLVQQWAALATQLRGVPRHLSQHPGGFLIAADDVSALVPVENASMEGRTVIQWDKDDLDTLKLIKVDVLALGMLSAIRRALDWVGTKNGQLPQEIMAQTARQDDPAVYDMLCSADAVGVFQVESRAQLSMLPRLRPRCYYDLVIEVAIVRPGPIQGGMVHPYLKRRSGEEAAVYPKPELKEALGRTLGVPIFQEQVMQLAMIAADFTAGEADQLRRAMAAWKRRGGLEPFHDRLVGRMVAKGYTLEFAESIFRQIQGFGEYGFPESHAASFALLVYISAWLKRHHPDAFLVGLLNSQPMGFYAPAQLVRDARAHGVQVLPVDVMRSAWETELEGHGHAGQDGLPHSPPAASLRPVRLGLNRLSGFRQDAAERIVAARADAAFTSVEDLARRAALDAHALRLLADANALAGLAGHRREAAWAVAGVDTRGGAPMLGHSRTIEAEAPRLEEPSPGAALMADYRTANLSLTSHPLALLRQQLNKFKVLTSAQLRECRPGQLARASGLVTHRQRPQTAKGVIFVTLEDETGAVNVIVWPQVAEAQRTALLAARLLTVYGIWQRQGEVMHLVAKRLVDHSGLLRELDDEPSARNGSEGPLANAPAGKGGVPGAGTDRGTLKITSRDFR